MLHPRPWRPGGGLHHPGVRRVRPPGGLSNASEEKRKEQPGRWIHVSWGTDTNDSYPTTIEAVCKDRLNLLLDISSALSTTKTFVLGLNTRSTEDGFAIIRIEIQIKDGAQLSTLMNKLHQISGVLQVNRPVG